MHVENQLMRVHCHASDLAGAVAILQVCIEVVYPPCVEYACLLIVSALTHYRSSCACTCRTRVCLHLLLQDLPAKGIEPNSYSWALLMSAARYTRNADFALQASLLTASSIQWHTHAHPLPFLTHSQWCWCL